MATVRNADHGELVASTELFTFCWILRPQITDLLTCEAWPGYLPSLSEGPCFCGVRPTMSASGTYCKQVSQLT